MADRFRVLTGLAYPTDSTIDDALREFGRQATEAATIAARTQDPRDIDAARTSEAARSEAVAAAFESGAMVERVIGDVVEDLPEKSLPWLLEQGIVEPVTDVIDNAPKAKRTRAPKVDPPQDTHTETPADAASEG